MNNDILFFVRNPKESYLEKKSKEFNFITWYPKAFSKPNGISFFKFFIWYIFHFCGIFWSRHFSINLLYLENSLIHYTFIFPAFYRFPFMARCDLQFGDIWTSDNYKNQGIASYSLEHLLQLYCDKKVWFLCNVNNEASIKLALRSGFELVGRGYKNSRFINIFSKYILIK